MGDHSTGTPATIPSPPLVAAPNEPYSFCCGGRRCPQIIADDAGNVTITDPDKGSDCIEFTSEQASELRKWLARQGF